MPTPSPYTGWAQADALCAPDGVQHPVGEVFYVGGSGIVWWTDDAWHPVVLPPTLSADPSGRYFTPLGAPPLPVAAGLVASGVNPSSKIESRCRKKLKYCAHQR